jgi:ABC-type antimicrobial peptide transport system permease subunit
MAIDNNSESKSRKQMYLRMFLFALIGFALFFGGAWLRLTQVGAMKVASNPYAGPPPLLTCLFCGGFGIIFSAVVSLFKRKR